MANMIAGNRQVDILLVEDSPSDAHLMREVLGETKWLKHLHVVKDGVEALNFLHRQGKYEYAPRPALILLDLNLPKLDGKELLAAIKTDPHLQLIPVVVLTTSATPADILNSYKLHANSYIVKPLDLDDFIEVVQAIVHFWLGVATLPADALGTAG
jgi:chemotaxis family two-component system response regulator Rcp1